VLLKDKHVFVVEDDPMNLAVIRTILQRAGAIVPFDNWGDTTLDRLLTYPFKIDIILLDIMLPHQVSGYDIFEAIRQVPELQHIPIVAVTASDPDIEMNRARAKGFDGYISKPLDRFKFPREIAAILAGKAVWGNIDP
jgi:CheY-like chemotaxis protein